MNTGHASSTDTALALAPNTRLPIPVMLIWLCAFAGLAAYMVGCFVPGFGR